MPGEYSIIPPTETGLRHPLSKRIHDHLNSTVSLVVIVTYKPRYDTRSSAHYKLRHNKASTSSYRHFYFNRIARLWDSLPFIDLTSPLSSIKSHITKLLWAYFELPFDSTNTCMYLSFSMPLLPVLTFLLCFNHQLRLNWLSANCCHALSTNLIILLLCLYCTFLYLCLCCKYQ